MRCFLLTTTLACAVVSVASAADQKKPSLDGWSGTISERAVDQLPNFVATQANGATFVVAVIADHMTLQQFSAAAGKGFPQVKRDELDLDSQVLVMVVLKRNTNAVKANAFAPGEDGVGTLAVQWRLIEPFYTGRYPATCRVAPKKDLEKIRVELTDGTALGEIKLP